MRRFVPAALLAIVLPVAADTALYHNGVLTIPEVLVSHAQQAPALYENVALRSDANGRFSIIGADQRTLLDVQSISVEGEAYGPGTVIVIVNGFKSRPCARLDTARITRTGKTFSFAIPEEKQSGAPVCTTAQTPVITEFGIVTTGLAPDTYTLQYGELHVEFHYRGLR